MKTIPSIKAMALAGTALVGIAYASPRARIASVTAAPIASSPLQVRGDSGSIRDLIEGIKGANAIQCELIMQAFVGWTSSVPDRDVNAWKITQRLRHHVVGAADIAWLGDQMRGADGCAARASARVLGRSPSAAARSLLVGALGHANPQVRRLAAVGIGIRSDSTLNARLLALLRDTDPGVRTAAAWALGAVH